MAPHFVDGKYFQVRKQDRGSLRSSVFHPHTGGHESPCSRLSRGLDVVARVCPWASAWCMLSPSRPSLSL